MESKDKDDALSSVINTLELDIKAVIQVSDQRTEISRADVMRKLENSNSDEVREFLKLVRDDHGGSDIGILFITVGEFLLSAFLLILGILFVIPTFEGRGLTAYMLNYYGHVLNDLTQGGTLISLGILVNFLVAVILLLAAFYALKTARNNMRFLFR
jgi:hypothetical protein